MRRFVRLVGAGLVACVLMAVVQHPRGAFAADGQQYFNWAQQLSQTQAQLQQVNGQEAQATAQLEQAQKALQAAQQKADADRAQEEALQTAIANMARRSYETQGTWLTQLIGARDISQVWSSLAQAKLVANKQQTLLNQLRALRQRDEAIRDAARAQVDSVQGQLAHLQSQARDLEGSIGELAANVSAGGQITGNAAPVPANTLDTTNGLAGQCTWYAEQAWVTFSDPSSKKMVGDGADVVNNLSHDANQASTSVPVPGALVSWSRSVLPPHGHVALVASVAHDGSGGVAGYTVWEMNWRGEFLTDARYIPWQGPSSDVMFLAPPTQVDPVAEAQSKYGFAG
ncbi:MAG: CHAP domain-containing protein [Candidatus Dormibacteraeota bacterium]|nr:CHAP domain-containing protein [Candidatus Dormibacteraeota bacterium]